MSSANDHITNLYFELEQVWDELTTWYQAMTYRYPGSHLSRQIFRPDESETINCWHVTIALPGGKELSRPFPDEYIHKFKHLEEGPVIEYDFDPMSVTGWSENLLAWARR